MYLVGSLFDVSLEVEDRGCFISTSKTYVG